MAGVVPGTNAGVLGRAWRQAGGGRGDGSQGVAGLGGCSRNVGAACVLRAETDIVVANAAGDIGPSTPRCRQDGSRCCPVTIRTAGQ